MDHVRGPDGSEGRAADEDIRFSFESVGRSNRRLHFVLQRHDGVVGPIDMNDLVRNDPPLHRELPRCQRAMRLCDDPYPGPEPAEHARGPSARRRGKKAAAHAFVRRHNARSMRDAVRRALFI